MPLPKVFRVLKLRSQSGESPASPAKLTAFVGVTLVKTNPFEWADRHTLSADSCSTAADIQSLVASTGREEHNSAFFDLLQLEGSSAEFHDKSLCLR